MNEKYDFYYVLSLKSFAVSVHEKAHKSHRTLSMDGKVVADSRLLSVVQVADILLVLHICSLL